MSGHEWGWNRLKYWHRNYRQGDIVAYTWIVFLIEFNCGKYTPLNELLIQPQQYAVILATFKMNKIITLFMQMWDFDVGTITLILHWNIFHEKNYSMYSVYRRFQENMFRLFI